MTHMSEQEKEHFQQVLSIPENCLIASNEPNWTKNLDDLTTGKEFAVIISSVPTQSHYDLGRYLKKNGQYLFVGGGSNVPHLGLFGKSSFSRGASFTTFDMMDMIHDGGEDLKE